MSADNPFLAAILANPADNEPRLHFADWLQGCGSDDAPAHLRDAARGEFIVTQIEIARLLHEHAQTDDLGYEPLESLRRRERELCRDHGVRWEQQFLKSLGPHHPFTVRDPSKYVCDLFIRGFIGRIRLSWFNWSRHAPAIRASQPVTEVVLTTPVSLEFNDQVYRRSARIAGTRRHFRSLTGLPESEWQRAVVSQEWPGITFTLPPARSNMTMFPGLTLEYTGTTRGPGPFDVEHHFQGNVTDISCNDGP